jgi:hypothetical protein
VTFKDYKALMITRNPKLGDDAAVMTITVRRFWDAQQQAWEQAQTQNHKAESFLDEFGMFGPRT